MSTQNLHKQDQDMQKCLSLFDQYLNILQYQKKQDLQNWIEVFGQQEKFIYFALQYINENLLNQLQIQEVLLQIDDFIKSGNQKAILFSQKQQTINNGKYVITKVLDMVQQKQLEKCIKPIQKLGEYKAITYNNLAIIYQQLKLTQLALKSFQASERIQLKLISENYKNYQSYIIETQLSIVTIYSNLKKHQLSVKTLNSIILNIDKLLKEHNKQNSIDKEQLDEPKNYNNQISIVEISPENQSINKLKSYKMISFYNLGVENEFLFKNQQAQQYYKNAYQVCLELNDKQMQNKLEDLIKN